MAEKEQRVKAAELSNEAHLALWYALAVVKPLEFEVLFKRMVAHSDMQARQLGKHVLSDKDKKIAIENGLKELYARGLVGAVRDGEGNYVPGVVRTDLLDIEDFGLILAQGY